jgi:hypothetical protein
MSPHPGIVSSLLFPETAEARAERARVQEERVADAAAILFEAFFKIVQRVDGDWVEAARLLDIFTKVAKARATALVPKKHRGKAKSDESVRARIVEAYRTAPLKGRYNAVAAILGPVTDKEVTAAMKKARGDIEARDAEQARVARAAEMMLETWRAGGDIHAKWPEVCDLFRKTL